MRILAGWKFRLILLIINSSKFEKFNYGCDLSEIGFEIRYLLKGFFKILIRPI